MSQATPSSARFLISSSFLYLGLVWFLSGLSRSAGVVIFGVGLALLAGALALVAKRRWRPLFALYLAGLLAGTVAGGLELTLRLAPGILTGAVANRAYGGYHAGPGGIYERDDHLGYVFRPSLSRRIYWNGHWWTHEANAARYRGPERQTADTIFLGDSMIYGHGVETAETVSERYASRTGHVCVNLGQQGACLVQMWLKLRRWGPVLRPGTIIICSHPNDVTESALWYPPDELDRFVEDTSGDFEPKVRPRYAPRPWRVDRFWNDHIAPPLRLAGALRGEYLRWRGKEAGGDDGAGGQPSAAGPFVPPPAEIDAPFDPLGSAAPETLRRGWRVHTAALERICGLARALGARVVLLDLGYPRAFCSAIQAEAARLGTAYSPAGRDVLERALAGEEVYLSRDGHWSPLGNDAIASALAACVREMPAASK